MSESKRATIYLEPSVHKALRIKAAEIGSTISELANLAFEDRQREPSRAFHDVLKDLKRDGLI